MGPSTKEQFGEYNTRLGERSRMIPKKDIYKAGNVFPESIGISQDLSLNGWPVLNPKKTVATCGKAFQKAHVAHHKMYQPNGSIFRVINWIEKTCISQVTWTSQ